MPGFYVSACTTYTAGTYTYLTGTFSGGANTATLITPYPRYTDVNGCVVLQRTAVALGGFNGINS